MPLLVVFAATSHASTHDQQLCRLMPMRAAEQNL
jgi:hypothetical protein